MPINLGLSIKYNIFKELSYLFPNFIELVILLVKKIPSIAIFHLYQICNLID